MTDRQANLKRWAELAPGECVESTLIDNPTSNVWAFNGGVYTEAEGRFFPAILLSALLVAIRVRGWHYKLFSDETEVGNENPASWTTAYVLPSRLYPTNRIECQRAEPCDAMLASYIACLETEEKC